jgi:hypothetical protein
VVHDICSAIHPMAAASAFFRQFDLSDAWQLAFEIADRQAAATAIMPAPLRIIAHPGGAFPDR